VWCWRNQGDKYEANLTHTVANHIQLTTPLAVTMKRMVHARCCGLTTVQVNSGFTSAAVCKEHVLPNKNGTNQRGDSKLHTNPLFGLCNRMRYLTLSCQLGTQYSVVCPVGWPKRTAFRMEPCHHLETKREHARACTYQALKQQLLGAAFDEYVQ
jgi:hypothetical protein